MSCDLIQCYSLKLIRRKFNGRCLLSINCRGSKLGTINLANNDNNLLSMLKVTGLSLLLGSVALVVVLTQFFAPPATDGAHPLPVLLNPTNARIQQSAGKFVDGELQLKLNSLGLGAVTLATEDIAARDYPFLHLALEDPPHNMGIGISLKTSAKKKMGRLQSLEKRSPGSVWLAMTSNDP